jgi:hypothetical protein
MLWLAGSQQSSVSPQTRRFEESSPGMMMVDDCLVASGDPSRADPSEAPKA